MPKQLPPTPSGEHLRKQAKELLTQCRCHDLSALEIMRANHPAFAKIALDHLHLQDLRLCDAQLAIAREYGFPNWQLLKAHIDFLNHNDNAVAIEQDLIADPDYRGKLAGQKGMPPVGTRNISCYGIEYRVIDHGFVLSLASISRASDRAPMPHIDELQPVIEFSNLSSRLKALYSEVDRCTSRHLTFFDTMPNLFPKLAAPGVNMVMETQDPRCFAFHIDAARLHETILAHELAHIRIALVDGCEDYRNMRDYSEIPKVAQFQHIQSFVLDLKVNDFIEELGFDMSVINADQMEAIRAIAEHCALGNAVKTKRAAAGIAITIASAILEQKRWPKSAERGFAACLAMIRVGQPAIYELAERFASSVQKHGYSGKDTIRQIIDECAVQSFQATGDRFDSERDLVEDLPIEWMQDKDPSFMPGMPVEIKLDVWRAVAKHKIGSPLGYNIAAYPGLIEIKLIDGSKQGAIPIGLSYKVDTPHIEPPLQNSELFKCPPDLHRSHNPQIPPGINSKPAPQMAESAALPISHHHISKRYNRFLPSTSKQRYYMPGIGRWLSRAGFEPSIIESSYGYAFNNPTQYIDPSAGVPMPSVQPAAASAYHFPVSLGYTLDTSITPSFGTKECHYAFLGTRWTGVPCFDGWIIQHVIIDQVDFLCDTRRFHNDHSEFWEANKVSCRSGQLYYSFCGGPMDPTPIGDMFRPATDRYAIGHQRVVGYSQWWPKLPPSVKGWKPGMVQAAGCSMSTPGPVPAWIDYGQPKVLDLRYNCCDCPREWKFFHKP